jgi:adenine-specific DNA glycosylase
MWTLASDVQILHGRRICRPKPLCDQCSVASDCDYYAHVVSKDRVGRDRVKKDDARRVRTPRL